MEAVRDFIACEDTDRGPAPVQQPGVDAAAGMAGVDGALAALQAVGATAVEDAGSWGFRAASDFAGRVEEFSRTVEYLQLVAAAAVDRTRKQSANTSAVAAGAVTSWTTGWREAPGGWETGGSDAAARAGTAAAGATAAEARASSVSTRCDCGCDSASARGRVRYRGGGWCGGRGWRGGVGRAGVGRGGVGWRVGVGRG